MDLIAIGAHNYSKPVTYYQQKLTAKVKVPAHIAARNLAVARARA